MNSDETGFPWGEAEDSLTSKVDTSVPVSARIWNYWLGGKDYYPVDQVAGDEVAKVDPGQFTLARSCRYFTGRAVRFLAGEAGIRQFLDIGTGLPSHDNTHEIAQRVAPDSRVVYVDNDPLVLAHARALLISSPPGTTDYISRDLNDPASILEVARRKLDFSLPVAIMLMGILGHIGNPAEDDDHYALAIVQELKDALPPGGYLAIYEGVDTDPVHKAAIDHYNQSGAIPYHIRSPERIARFFDGLELIEPGVVPIHQWRPDPSPFDAPAVPSFGGVARKKLGSRGAVAAHRPPRAALHPGSGTPRPAVPPPDGADRDPSWITLVRSRPGLAWPRLPARDPEGNLAQRRGRSGKFFPFRKGRTGRFPPDGGTSGIPGTGVAKGGGRERSRGSPGGSSPSVRARCHARLRFLFSARTCPLNAEKQQVRAMHRL